MPFQYEVDFKHKGADGSVKLARTLTGSHRLLLSGVTDLLDVSLVEIHDTGTGTGKFRLTLTDTVEGERDDAATWDYEIFFTHRRADGTVRESRLATGSHFVAMSPKTRYMIVQLDELAEKGDVEPRLHFTLRDLDVSE